MRNHPTFTSARQLGFTYVGLLISIAILGAASAATVTAGSLMQRRSAEEQLLAIGMEFRNAIKSYYESGNGPQQRYPMSLADLEKDSRFPGLRRHLRRVYPDPLTGKEEWGLIPAPGGGIMGVFSLSKETPIKIGQFPAEMASFEAQKSYAGWGFSFVPPVVRQ